jgi:16S rRNA (uracil1498-N3)-methyltransferase
MWLYVGLIKRDKFEWLIEKATEIGVAGVVPLDTDRAVKKGLKYDRARTIIVQAAEQSGRAWLPDLGAVRNIHEALKQCDLAHCGVLDAGGGAAISSIEKYGLSTTAFFIGPEGGWSERERQAFHDAGISSISLGPQNLKTETAAVSVSSLTLLSQ